MVLDLTMEIDKELKGHADFLVDKVNQLENIMKDIIQNINVNHEKNAFGKSQIQNLLKAVHSASSIKEIILFIQYQMGRDEDENSWRKADESKIPLGNQIINILEEIEQKAAERFAHRGNEPIRELSLRMAERFFQYWHWKYSYLVTAYGKKKNQQSSDHRGGKRA
jgi:hypothetical protein